MQTHWLHVIREWMASIVEQIQTVAWFCATPPVTNDYLAPSLIFRSRASISYLHGNRLHEDHKGSPKR